MEGVLKCGYVYKISSPSTEKCYIGSTCDSIKLRLQRHQSAFRAYSNNKMTLYTSSFEIIKFNDAIVEELEEVTFTERIELLKREHHYILNNVGLCVNMSIPGRTQLQYYYDNHDKILDKMKIQKKEYYKANRETIINKMKAKYNEKNFEQIEFRKLAKLVYAI